MKSPGAAATTTQLSILLIDDEQTTLFYLKTLLQPHYKVHLARNRQEALALLQRHPIDMVLLDILLGSGENGLELLKELRQKQADLDVIVISGVQMVQTVVQAIQLGAADYINKPIEKETLFLALDRVIKQRHLQTSNTRLREELRQKQAADEIIGDSAAITQLKEMAAELKHQNVNVFIVGDTGTGKEKFARLIHDQENNPTRPFISINCAAIPENLLESTLFGHERGAFTGATERRLGKFELAHGGDLFLDEISCLSPELQAKLLRVLEEKEIERVGGNTTKRIDFRVISASNDNIIELVAAGRFRKDLFYRLNTVTLQLPALNERKQDIIPLVEYFLNRYRRTPEPKKLSPEVKELLIQHHWRGNVRELKNTVENMIIFAKGSTIQVGDIPFLKNGQPMATAVVEAKSPSAPGHPESVNTADRLTLNGSYDEVMHKVEREVILRSLERNKWNKSKTCRDIGIKRNKLYRKMVELGIDYV